MQLRKVCNHPDLFEPRPIISSFDQPRLDLVTSSLAPRALEYEPTQHVDLAFLLLSDLPSKDLQLPSYLAQDLAALRSRLTPLELPAHRPAEEPLPSKALEALRADLDQRMVCCRLAPCSYLALLSATGARVRTPIGAGSRPSGGRRRLSTERTWCGC